MAKLYFSLVRILCVMFILNNNTGYVWCCYHQSPLDGKPNFVSPSLAKLDLKGLRHDIPKYYQNIPKTASDTWEHWLDKVDVLVHIPVL